MQSPFPFGVDQSLKVKRKNRVFFPSSPRLLSEKMVAVDDSYEECRRKRVEENKKRMEALNLPRLSLAFRNRKASSFKPSPKLNQVKKPLLMEKEQVLVRRSSRVSKNPAPVYAEVRLDRLSIPRRISRSRDFSDRVYASSPARKKAIDKAEQLKSELDPQFPTFIKPMLPSHVSGGFWLGLPVQFCKTWLSKTDGVMTLIDEEGEEFQTIYLARKTGLSGGWKGFSVAHELADGDALIFQLIKPTAFKVDIVRVNNSEEDH